MRLGPEYDCYKLREVQPTTYTEIVQDKNITEENIKQLLKDKEIEDKNCLDLFYE